MGRRGWGAVAVAVLAGCGPLERDPSLERMESCEALRAYLEEVADREARWTYRFDWGIFPDYNLYALSGHAAPSAAADYSTTNVQEAGVDEADLVETDGTWLYAAFQGHPWRSEPGMITVARAWPVESGEVVAEVEVEGTIDGIFLLEDATTLVALSTVDEEDTLATVVDTTDPTAPEVVRRTRVEGGLADSRRIGSTLYVVVRLDERFWYAGDAASARAAIRRADAEDWLPGVIDDVLVEGEWRREVSTACACTDVWTSPRRSGSEVTAVLALDVSDPLSAFSGTAVVGAAETVYASRDHLYVAWSERSTGPFKSLDDSRDTMVHAFDLAGGSPSYLDTVSAWGVLTDQFALSEHEGALRLATTDHYDWTTHVFTWDVGEDLEPLDHLGGLAPGEELYAVRFVGDLGFLVTYVVAHGQTVFDIELGDPLFTLDLSDPAHIREVGELVMNGWSDYLHPMGDSRLLAVGMDEATWNAWEAAVSLFDVSDLEQPALVDREYLGTSHSEALEDHHAFTYHPPREALALPISDEDAGAWQLSVLHVDPDDLDLRGFVDVPDWPWGCARVRRSVIMEDRVWAVAEGGMVAAALDDPETALAEVRFEGVPCD